MEKIIVFGAGNTGRRFCQQYCMNKEIVAIIDNDENKYNSDTLIEGIRVEAPSRDVLCGREYDRLIIASVEGQDSIKEQCLSFGVSLEKIDIWHDRRDAYDCYFENLAELFKQNSIVGDIAELGVYKGVTASKMNRTFSERKLHLFDTFEGFVVEDVEYEKDQDFSDASVGRYGDTSVELVMELMPYPDQVVLHKGFFPDTTKDVVERFSLVRIDMDLAQPTRAALDFFHNNMVKGGVMLIHDYFGGHYKGVKFEVDRYLKKHPTLIIMPTGDPFSIAIGGY